MTVGFLLRPHPEKQGRPPGRPTSRTPGRTEDRKSTRLNSSHANISYAVFCLKKKKTIPTLLRHQHIYGPPISTLKLNDTMQARYFRTFVSLLTSSRWHL